MKRYRCRIAGEGIGGRMGVDRRFFLVVYFEQVKGGEGADEGAANFSLAGVE